MVVKIYNLCTLENIEAAAGVATAPPRDLVSGGQRYSHPLLYLFFYDMGIKIRREGRKKI
jgi:hypothetical protein